MNASAPFVVRFARYLQERFPPLGNGLLVVVFTASAIAYSVLSRGESAFVSGRDFAVACGLTVGLFLLLRISDEHKDAAEDRLHRPTLPVPRGLVTLAELRWVALGILVVHAVLLGVWAQPIVPLYALALLYMGLMLVEFGVPAWLKRHAWAYNGSHMVIIPLVDLVASGFDWRLRGLDPSTGLMYFFAVSYCNGVVLELGRKLGTPGTPDEGRRLYTTRLGQGGAVTAYLVALLVTLLLAQLAAWSADYGSASSWGLLALFVLAGAPAVWHLRALSVRSVKATEIASGVWTLGMYLLLGALPMLLKLLGL